jgi:hypothetical protein
MKGKSIIGLLIENIGSYMTSLTRTKAGKGATWTLNIHNPKGYPIKLNENELADALLKGYSLVCGLKGTPLSDAEHARYRDMIDGVDKVPPKAPAKKAPAKKAQVKK